MEFIEATGEWRKALILYTCLNFFFYDGDRRREER